MFGLPAIADDFAQLAAGRPDGDALDRLDRRLGRSPDGVPAAIRTAPSGWPPPPWPRSPLTRTLTCAGGPAWRARAPAAAIPSLPVPGPGGRRVAVSQRLEIDPIACTGHGLCADLLPERIDLDEWGYPHPRRRAAGPCPHARRAVRACPALALRLQQAGGDHDGRA